MSIRDKDTRRLPNLALQEERLQRGWTQQEVADRVGTTVVNVSRWERGATSPNPYFRQKLCLLFEKEAGDLGLLPMRQMPQSETEPTIKEISPDLPEEELVATSKTTDSLPIKKLSLGEHKIALTALLITLVILVSGSGFLIHSFFFSQPGSSAHSSSYKAPTPTPALVGKVIAQDAFQRANQTFWGVASDGLKWGGDANTWTNFSISNNVGQLVPQKGGVTYNAILGPSTNDAEVLFNSSISTFSDSNLGAVLRWSNTNNLYKAYINGNDLIIQRKVTGTAKVLAQIPFPASAGTSYTIRFRVVGTLLSAKVWPTASNEPGKWTAITSDSSLSSGYCGLRIEVLNDAIATVTSFEVRQAS